MITTKRNLLFVTILVILFQIITYSQTEPDKFIVGTLAASMPPPYDVIIINNDALYDTILSCGFNSIYQKVAKGYPIDNSVNLSKFEYIYAANDSSTLSQHITFPENGDWINYFTQAKYFRWEAEGDNYFPDVFEIGDSSVGIKHNNIGSITTDGNAWRSGANTTDIGKNFIDGPNYTQYNRYVYKYKSLNNPTPYINYKVDFNLKLGSLPQQPTDVVKIIVYLIDRKTGNNKTLDSLIINSSELSNISYTIKSITYKGDSLKYKNLPLNQDYPNPPGIDYYSPEAISADWIDFNKKIQYRVQRLSNVEVIVDYIDVYDQVIYDFYFIRFPSILRNNILNYLNSFSSLGNKLKYFYSLDEPHTWDSFIPIKKVQEILDDLGTGKEILVHFYPEYRNKKEGATVLDKWMHYANPKKLMFWYAPFTCDTNYTPHSRVSTLEYFREVLQTASLSQDSFFVTLQAWGQKPINNPTVYNHWMTPTPAEIGAETMLALAHGVKGLFYEPYYSYESSYDSVEALVDYPHKNFVKKLNWYKVQSLANRLTGNLGSALFDLSYNQE